MASSKKLKTVNEVPLWMPSRYPKSLTGTEEFPTHGTWLLKLVDLVWRLPDGSTLKLDPWQRWLINHALEIYPPGHKRAGQLRYRRVMISMARQNGKSILGAIFGLYGLVRESGALVIGIASSAEQARIVYTRLLAVINGHPSLAAKFERLTDTRGITGKNASRYEIKASKSAAVQGLDVSVGLADELHIMAPTLWTDMVNGTKARRNGVVIGITTAGDDTSELLKDLYQQVDDAPSERYGYFIWEAPEASVPKEDALLEDYLRAANPAAASGRLDLEDMVESIRAMPEPDAVRYNLNRFVKSSNSYIPLHLWSLCRGTLATKQRPIFAIDRTPDWTAASIVAAWKGSDGIIYTQVVASLVRPTLDKLESICVTLSKHSPATFVADSYTLKSLIDNLKRRGLPARTASLGDNASGASLLYAKTIQRKLVHADDPVLTVQMPKAIRKNVGDAYRIARLPGTQIDAVIATMLAVYFAEITKDEGIQLF